MAEECFRKFYNYTGSILSESSRHRCRGRRPTTTYLRKVRGIFFTACAFIILKFGNFAVMQWLTPIVFALSRDGLVLFSEVY